MGNEKKSSVERALNIITILADSNKPIPFNELLEITGISKSTLYRLLTILQKEQFVEKVDDLGWRTSKQVLRMGLKELEKLDLKKESKKYMLELAESTLSYVQLGVLVNEKVMYVDHVTQETPLSIYTGLGTLLAINQSAIGMVIASGLPENEIDYIIKEGGLPKKTDKTISDKEKFIEYLAQVKEQGYAIDDEMYSNGIYCIGAPILDRNRNVIAGVGISGIKRDFTMQEWESKIHFTKKAAMDISENLGHIDY